MNEDDKVNLGFKVVNLGRNDVTLTVVLRTIHSIP